MTKTGCRIIVAGLLLCLLNANVFAGQETTAKEKDSTNTKAGPLVLPIHFYRAHLSKVDGNRCQMEPSCSTFCIDALKKHGFFLGWIMCSDRLVRCGRDEKKASPTVWVNNRKRIVDPVGNNDFWW